MGFLARFPRRLRIGWWTVLLAILWNVQAHVFGYGIEDVRWFEMVHIPVAYPNTRAYTVVMGLAFLEVILQGFLFSGFYSRGDGTWIEVHGIAGEKEGRRDEGVWGPPTAWGVFIMTQFFFGFIAPSFLLAAIFAVPG